MCKIFKKSWPILLLTLFISSCLTEKTDDCPSGLSIQFIYNLYNQEMEFADAFNNTVNQITLFVFDEQGNYISKHSEAGDVLKRREYRMFIPNLTSGNYQIVVWGGVENGSFEVLNSHRNTSNTTDLIVTMDNSLDDGLSRTELSPLYYGSYKVVNHQEDKITSLSIPLVKNTNTFRILLQTDNEEGVDFNDFTFEIIDNNSALNSRNELALNHQVRYIPYSYGNVNELMSKADSESLTPAVYAELSTSKLFEEHSKSARLRIYNTKLDREVLDLPLIEMVLLMKNEKFNSKLTNRDYLDRIHSFYMTFFLHNNVWQKSHITINGWTIRFNEISDLQ